MDTNIAVLLQLHVLEQRIKQLQSQLAAGPLKQAGLERELAPAREELRQRQAMLEANQAERRQMDEQIQELRLKISQFRSHSAEVKTNQEYRAMLDEIGYAEREIRQREDRILALMEQSEEIEKQIGAASEALSVQEAKRQEWQRAWDMEAAEARLAQEQLIAQCEQLRVQVEASLLYRYDRLAKLRGNALSELEHETCGACRVRLRPQFLQELNNHPDRVYFCEFCGRILYHQPAVEPPFTGDVQLAAKEHGLGAGD